ncbi:MAG TPA: AI-2E family transporter [Candidatus Paceibacterota bacterium]|nr:AI-2E family transporter [Candidatus Paceibacterota bacterium]
MHKETFSSLQRFLFIGVLIGVSVLFIWVLMPFVMSVFWAVVLAIILYPIFLRLSARFKRPTLAALSTMLIALIIVGVPLYLIGTRTVIEGLDLYHRVTSGELSVSTLTEAPFVVTVLDTFGIVPSDVTAELTSFIQNAGGTLATEALVVGKATANVFLKGGVMLYLLFFFLRDGAALVLYLQRIIPFGDERERILFKRFTSTTRAVIKGTLIVSLAQGFVGGVLFAIVGISNPILWGVLMAFCATIPAIGPFIVWLPAGLLLLATGSLWQALVVILGGIFIIGTVDNVIRPLLVGRDIEMPDALVLLAILGGVATFGIAGIIIGPVIGALFLSIWDLFGKDFSEEIALHG